MSGTVVVTGAASGIGRAAAIDLAVDGWTVYAFDLEPSGLETLARELAPQSVELVTIQCDVSVLASVEDAFRVVSDRSRRLDALVHCAGILRTGRLTEMNVADFDQVFAVNTRGAWLTARMACRLMTIVPETDIAGRMVFVSSIAAFRPKVDGGAYAASKSALSQLVRVLGAELAEQRILVNAVAPSTVDTPMIRALAKDSSEAYRPSGTSPLGRVATPSDIVPPIRFLLDRASNFMTGSTLVVDGGTSAAYTK